MHKHKKPKKATYGGKRISTWCLGCDQCLVQVLPSKKRARREGKKEIEEAMNEYDRDTLAGLICEEFDSCDFFFCQPEEYIASIKRLGLKFKAFNKEQFEKKRKEYEDL